MAYVSRQFLGRLFVSAILSELFGARSVADRRANRLCSAEAVRQRGQRKAWRLPH